MTQIKVAILGHTGMLGHQVLHRFHQTCHGQYITRTFPRQFLNAETTSVSELACLLDGADYAINCIGVIKPRIDEQDQASVQRAVQVNALFPYLLAQAAERTGARVLQIATDCVYSGTGQSAGQHDEFSPHDPLDVYGKTKSLGEVRFSRVCHLRCSIIGQGGSGGPQSLLGWFLGQPENATVNAYTNHLWNGVTTLAFARICHGIMQAGSDFFDSLPHISHVVPAVSLTKAELLRKFAYHYHRHDLLINDCEALTRVDRTLTTMNPGRNLALWQAAGYAVPPSIGQMVEEMAKEQQ
jgi:dTDP-4-dehydrorhamnose reductase